MRASILHAYHLSQKLPCETYELRSGQYEALVPFHPESQIVCRPSAIPGINGGVDDGIGNVNGIYGGVGGDIHDMNEINSSMDGSIHSIKSINSSFDSNEQQYQEVYNITKQV